MVKEVVVVVMEHEVVEEAMVVIEEEDIVVEEEEQVVEQVEEEVPACLHISIHSSSIRSFSKLCSSFSRIAPSEGQEFYTNSFHIILCFNF